MKTIILIRHGESETNLSKKFTGQLDIGLTERGIRQAELMAKYLDNYDIDVIYASSLKRAYNTAMPIKVHQGCKIIKCDDFKEINAGAWHGKTFDEIKKEFPNENRMFWTEDISKTKIPGGESCVELYERVVKKFRDIVEDGKENTVCIVTHATPIRMIESYMSGKGIGMAKDIDWVPNASASIYRYDGKFETVHRGYCEYLGDMLTNLPKGV